MFPKESVLMLMEQKMKSRGDPMLKPTLGLNRQDEMVVGMSKEFRFVNWVGDKVVVKKPSTAPPPEGN
jgi:hypothetical protein